MQRWLALIALVALAVPGGAVAGPGGGGSGGTGGGTAPPDIGRQSRDRDGSTLPVRESTPGMRLEGRVTDRSGKPLSGIMVKMFTNGMTVASASTDVDGSFAIETNPSIGGNNTTDVWFQGPGTTDLLPTNVILSLGSVAGDEGLYSPCTPRINFLGSAARVEVKMLTLAERKAFLEESDCLSSEGTP